MKTLWRSIKALFKRLCRRQRAPAISRTAWEESPSYKSGSRENLRSQATMPGGIAIPDPIEASIEACLPIHKSKKKRRFVRSLGEDEITTETEEWRRVSDSLEVELTETSVITCRGAVVSLEAIVGLCFVSKLPETNLEVCFDCGILACPIHGKYLRIQGRDIWFCDAHLAQRTKSWSHWDAYLEAHGLPPRIKTDPPRPTSSPS